MVLHLRKNRQQVVNEEQVSSKDNFDDSGVRGGGLGEIKYLPTLNSDAEDLDIASRGTRELGSEQLTSAEHLLNSQGGMASPRSNGGGGPHQTWLR